jgi:hypothetical protein
VIPAGGLEVDTTGISATVTAKEIFRWLGMGQHEEDSIGIS